MSSQYGRGGGGGGGSRLFACVDAADSVLQRALLRKRGALRRGLDVLEPREAQPQPRTLRLLAPQPLLHLARVLPRERLARPVR